MNSLSGFRLLGVSLACYESSFRPDLFSIQPEVSLWPKKVLVLYSAKIPYVTSIALHCHEGV